MIEFNCMPEGDDEDPKPVKPTQGKESEEDGKQVKPSQGKESEELDD
ncbi:hypothetical protein [Altibacter sp. HG106]|nr:hypothetical protein [Altibacter sp. HG106]MDC7994476.1 hypothetical protein [Altibacter sp. HG106]